MTSCLGHLESSDYGPLSPERKDAVNAFWQTYFADQNREPEIQMDGMVRLAPQMADGSAVYANGQ